jgi:DNA primase catalytic subunit
VLAIQIIGQAMEEHFGYRQLLWVYSGQRGVHLWVCDHDALLLDDKERQRVMYHLTAFQLLNGKEVSTWRPEGGRQEGKTQLKKDKLVGRMRREIEPVFQ